MTSLVRQHLIDPDVCIRCNTCEEACPERAISHDKKTYAVSFDLCNGCGDCLPPCPTGAIDSWRRVHAPYSVAEQLSWDSLPADLPAPAPTDADPAGIPAQVTALAAQAAGSSGHAPPPWSAAHPYVALYGPDAPAVATVVGNHRLTDDDADSDIRHIVLDFGKTAFPVLEGQTIGVIAAGRDDEGKPHRMRLYSVASPREGERPRHNNLALTVKRVSVDRDGRPVRGVASNYLCDLERGARLEVCGPYGTSFLMPNHPGAKLLMICTGTGAAPMRAMTERRRRRQGRSDGGSILLFFGARRPGELPYFGPLMKLPPELIQVELAFSRLKGEPKEYVQDRMRKRADDVAKMLFDDDCFVYLCGHKQMEAGVEGALGDICAARGRSWPQLRDVMRRAGRFHLETY